MDVFAIHEQVIADYRAFTSGFVEVRDRRIKAFVEEQFATGVQWPDPWLSLNPSFASGGAVPDLVEQGLLHRECTRIFRRKNDRHDQGRDPLVLHQHQREAIEAARTGRSYVLTTGTGSGKSLAYIIPIVDAVLRERENHAGRRSPGVKAIVVYPMNALANSQLGELEKFLQFGYTDDDQPVTFARYTGQESPEERRRILADPPDILLTNYVMLELVLTRPDERKHLVRAARGLRFLALDELHTYRGRQGADVAMLIRRLRDQCAGDGLQIIGTSATMSSEGALAQRKAVVAAVATRLFGSEVTADRVIGETIVRATSAAPAPAPELRAAADAAAAGRLPSDHRALTADPLAGWVETTFGVDTEAETGRLIRRTPTTVTVAAEQLAEVVGLPSSTCATALREMLRAGSRITDPGNGRTVFAFRLHQFLSKGDGVFVSLEPEGTRHVTGTYQVSVPGKPDHALLPVGFCRECGQEYLVVASVSKKGERIFVPRRDADASGGDAVTGYLYISNDLPWPKDPVAEGRLPDSWLVVDPDTDQVDILDSKRKYQPEPVFLSPDGAAADEGLPAWFLSTPFAFCLRCGVSYEQVRGNDFGKLATLDVEGRSSAISVLSGAVVRALRGVDPSGLDPKARKLLTFVDNRQDASLQAGHFNDFVQVTQLRGALSRALAAAGPAGLGHEDVASAVTSMLSLAVTDFAQAPEAKFTAKTDAEKALRGVVEYQLYIDLQRGWRVTMPNLEQVGLLVVDYRDLPDIAADPSSWQGTYLLDQVGAEQREEIMRILLDEFRRVRAIDVDILSQEGFERVKKASRGQLIDPWALGDDDQLVDVGTAFPRSAGRGGPRAALALTGRTAFGRYLRKLDGLPPGIVTADVEKMITDLLAVLTVSGVLSRTDGPAGSTYRLKAGALRWRVGGGEHGAPDPLRRSFKGEETARVNPFFRELYRELASGYTGLSAREHTAQVPQEQRLEREQAFREGRLPLLYCSPTMELGVDISDLNAVAMRNVPPTPANYAQRSGRAGRSGQQALVLTYCSTGKAHDSYWFRRSRDMVAGSVIAPRLDLTNEDLVRSHLHAIWLAESDQSMHSSITDLLETGGESPSLRVLPTLWSALTEPGLAKSARITAQRVMDDLRRSWQLDHADPAWWFDGWVAEQLDRAAQAFDNAFDRWRTLYSTALAEANEQHRLAISTTASRNDRMLAERRRTDARNQLALLRNEDSERSATDFYSYRYLASEGFLPGYSFPRLPLAAYIPARRGARRDGDFLQRPRFVAIGEFGPNALIYHEGARYEVTRVQLPRDPNATSGSGAVTEEARRCENCGYHHPVGAGTDMCEHCGHRLGTTQYGLLRLQTVFTRRRERISSDEEERRRSGYELETSFRFTDRGDRPGHTAATATGPGGAPLLELVHADAALVRVANVGRRRRKNAELRGYWLDTREGAWLTDKQAADSTVDSENLEAAADVATKQLVVPFVEDRRNVLVIRLVDTVDEEAAWTFRAALERAIEATFQLEDSELDAQGLPDPDHHAQMLLTEAAEGGAGVLGRLVAEPAALAAVARKALEIIHYDPDGTDLGHAPGARERCERGCYDCLLSYSNQGVHAQINRHTIVELLQQLANTSVTRGAGGRDRTTQQIWLNKLRDSDLEKKFVDWLTSNGYRLPDDAQVTVESASARPDLVYRLADTAIAVFVDGPHHDSPEQRLRDAAAADRLADLGWSVVRFGYNDDWTEQAARWAWVFGPGRTTA